MNRKKGYKKIADFMKRREIVSLSLILLFVVLALSSIFISPQLYRWSEHEGDVALKDIYGPYDFTYSWGIDEEATEKAKEEAAAAVPYALRRDLQTEEKVVSGLGNFFDILEEERAREVSEEEKIINLKNTTGVELSDRNLKELLEYADPAEIRERTIKTAEAVFQDGFIDDSDLSYLKEAAERVVIFKKVLGAGVERKADDLLDSRGARDAIEKYVSSQFKGDRKVRQAVVVLISGYVSPNLIPDGEKTKELKEEEARKAPPVYHSWTVKKNELIIERGERVNARHIAQISQLRRVFRPGKSPMFFLGILLLFFLLGLIAVIHTIFTQRTRFLRNTKDIAIVLLNMFFIIVVSDLIMRSPQPSYFIPMASIGMIISLLIGFNVAFLSVVVMSVLISILIGGKIELALVLMMGSVVGIFAVRGARRRSSILWAGLFAGLAKFMAVVCTGLINSMDMEFYLRDGMWGIASGVLSGFIVMGLLPVFEYFFKVPTNISLLELSDLNHPLLRRLAMEAPGTYHHSTMVGNLAEAACDSIGANSLLARVGAYYHDIGKISKAEYYSENEMGAGSKHSSLTPRMSALIIAKHVKEGMEMAKKHKLNNAIIDFITQHHGNSLISYFYQKAIEKSEDGTVPDEENFRYAGPKPQTKESAIVLLADSVEASSRALDNPTPSSIENLVKKIINNKFIDGQLDECDLTLKDMHQIAESFVRALVLGFFHTRLNYPEETANKGNNGSSNGNKGRMRKQKRQKKG